ncbi:hypothetical protein GTQ34_09905 [Muricauda sp. JGD-17]|uniref:Uncharacterized protein n=1 Tax=Flagellimonas ochracea TaxID=2696472 RepID=A0A964TC99_9FLAO|nr:hypothetical protein [Allomuricauda ochracea]NAY92233.1 hypothetical protein [Allomuricauda ochracea]
MKQLVVVLVVLTTIGAMGQRHEGRGMDKGFHHDLTPEQLATLKTKKLTLALDLTQAQQDEVMKLSLVEAENRKARREEIKGKKESGDWEEPTPEQRFEMENARLDRQIAQQQKMKQVLTEEQYEVWKKMRLHKSMHSKKKMQERGRRG